tara:strand:- start:2008 stop:3156 length:1149 start_codon:yes stop_codon:yes gene_type:complete
MNILINNYLKTIKVFTDQDIVYLDKFEELSKFKEHQLEIFIIDPQIHNNKVSLPPAKSSVLKKLIPHILKSESLIFKEDSHFSHKKIGENEFAHISFVDREWIQNLFNSINKNELSVSCLIPLESCGKEKTATIYEHGNFSTVNFSNLWGWTAETELVSDLIAKGIKEFNCSKLTFCSDNKNTSFNLNNLDIKNFNRIEEAELLSEFNSEIEMINLLKDSFSPKIDWNKLFKPYRFLLASLALLMTAFFSTKILEINELKKNADDLINSANQLYFVKNPGSSKKELEVFLAKNSNLDKNLDKVNFVEVLFNISGIINSNDKVSLSTVVFDSSKKEFLVEIESIEFDDLEVLKEVFKNQGFSLQEGSSRRVGNTILSEILIRS